MFVARVHKKKLNLSKILRGGDYKIPKKVLRNLCMAPNYNVESNKIRFQQKMLLKIVYVLNQYM